ncbi:MAG: anti-sigma factor [Bacteroidia bacterium]
MKNILFISLIAISFLTACDNTDDLSNLDLNLTGLEDLGAGYAYEGWVIVDGSPVSTGTFTVDGSGTLSQTSFEVDAANLDAATMFVLSIEPSPDNDPAPAATKILSGAFSGASANLSTGTVGDDFEGAAGKYFLAAPTGSGDASENFSGLWFIDNTSGSMMPGLNLPTLNAGWKYEGWVVIDGNPLSTGTFSAGDAADEGAPFSGTNPGPPFPGEDFLLNAPSGLTFPTDLRGRTVVVSIEPTPDNSPAPFVLKPLLHNISATLGHATADEMMNNTTASFPKGSVMR